MLEDVSGVAAVRRGGRPAPPRRAARAQGSSSSAAAAPPRPGARGRTRGRSPRRSAPPPSPAPAGRGGPCSESCSVVGIGERRQRAVEHVAVAVLAQQPGSSTALVSSSTNSGTPSVLATICSSSSAGSALPPATCSTMRRGLPRAEAVEGQQRGVGVAGPGRRNSGRKVTTSSTGSAAIRSTTRSKSSSVVGSIQCASSKTHQHRLSRRRGPRAGRAAPRSVRALRCCGRQLGRRVAPRRSACRAASASSGSGVARVVRRPASSASSLASRARLVVRARSRPRARAARSPARARCWL